MSSILLDKETLALVRNLLNFSLERDNINQNLDDFCIILGLQESEWACLIHDNSEITQATLSDKAINAIYSHIYVPIAQLGETLVLSDRKFQSPSEFIDYVRRN